MGILTRRPLAAVCFSFFACLTLSAFIGTIPSLCLVAVASAYLFPLLFRRKGTGSRPLHAALAVAVALAGLLGAFAFGFYFSRPEKYGEEVLTVQATVTDIRSESYGRTVFYAHVERIDGKPTNLHIEATADGTIAVEIGDCVTFRTSLCGISSSESEIYYRADGICATADELQDLQIIGHSFSLFTRLRLVFSAWRDILSDYITRAMPDEGGALVSAILLGRRELLSSERSLLFRRLGLSHILAISGLHLSILSAVLFFITKRLRLSTRASALVQIAFIVFYMLLTAFPLSLTRAGVMLLLLAASRLAARESDGITALAVAAAGITLFSPYAIYDCGFWLSVTATFGILVYNDLHKPKVKEENRLKRFLGGMRSSLTVTLSATFATLPLVALFFGEISLLTPLANLVFAPLWELFLILSFLALPLLWLSPVGWAVGSLGELALSLMRPLARLRGTMLSVDYVSVKVLFLLTVAGVLAVLCLARRYHRYAKRVAAVGLSAAALCILVFQLVITGQHAVVYNSHASNEQLLLYSGGRALLCDFSSGSYSFAADGVDCARTLHIAELDGYYLSHYHEAHAKSFARLAARTVIGTLYLPTPESEADEKVYRSLAESADRYGVRLVRYDPQEPLSFAGMEILPLAGASHGTAGVSIAYGENYLTYLGRGYHISGGAQAAGEVKRSTHLLFGAHGTSETSALPYATFSPDLSLVLVANDLSRLPSGLRAFLHTNSIPYRLPNGEEYISLT